MEIKLYNLPKVSLNEWYSGKFWRFRSELKQSYKMIIKSQYKQNLKGDFESVKYTFFFKSRPLDCTNCVAMVKLIEDVLFEKDGYKNVKQIVIESKKSSIDCVKINIFDKN